MQPQYKRVSPNTQKIEYDYELEPVDSGEWRVRVTCSGATWFEGYGNTLVSALALAVEHVREVVRCA